MEQYVRKQEMKNKEHDKTECKKIFPKKTVK